MSILRLIFGRDTDPEAALETLQKAMRPTLSAEDRAAAYDLSAVDAGELGGEVSRLFDSYQRTRAYYDLTKHFLIPSQKAQAQEYLARLRNQNEWLLRTSINRHYRDQFILGQQAAGIPRPPRANELELIRRLANNEAQYALTALDDAETHEFYMDMTNRGQLYGNAGREVFWLGWLYADLSHDRYVRWVISEAEHCIDCLFMAGKLDVLRKQIGQTLLKRQAKDPDATLTAREQALVQLIDRNKDRQGGRWGTGVYRAQELAKIGILPQAARLACTTKCQCHLENVRKPKKRPSQPEQTEPFKSLWPKRPTMLKRTTRPHDRVKRARLERKWSHEHIKRGDMPGKSLPS